MFWLEKYGMAAERKSSLDVKYRSCSDQIRAIRARQVKSRDVNVGTCIICCPTRKEGETVRPFTLATLCKFFEVRERWKDLPTFQGDVCRASFSHLNQTLEKKIVKSDPEADLLLS